MSRSHRLLVLRRAAEVAALAPGEPVPSPCTSVCRIDARSGWCEGCMRSIEEIANWRQMDDRARLQVWQALPARSVDLAPAQDDTRTP